jgi:hypothetical protein
MRYPATEKLEIIRLVDAPVRQMLRGRRRHAVVWTIRPDLRSGIVADNEKPLLCYSAFWNNSWVRGLPGQACRHRG